MNLVFQIISTAIFTVIGAFLSVVLTRLLIQNGKAVRDLGERMDEGFKRMDEGFRLIAQFIKETRDLAVSEGEETRKVVKELKR